MDFGIELETVQKESVTFKKMNIPNEILGNIRYPIATPIQRKVIPMLMNNEDVIAVSRTGSGKTYSYVIPILAKLLKTREKKSIYTRAKALIILPTYELADQVFSVIQELSNNGVHPALFTGTNTIAHSLNYLVVGQFEIAICTPGRLEHMLLELTNAEKNKPIYLKVEENGSKKDLSISDEQLLEKLTTPDIVVIDEMDRIFEDKNLSMSLQRILECIKVEPQYALFSATHHKGNTEIRNILNRKDLKLVEIIGGVSDHLEQDRLSINNLYVQEETKPAILVALLKKFPEKKILIFVSTCKRVQVLADWLAEIGFKPGVLSSTESEESRDQVVKGFKKNEISIVISTDVGCRGLDIRGIDVIIEYDYASKRATAVHRVGRMNRSKYEKGTVFSFIRAADISTYLAFLNHIYSEKPRDTTRETRLCFTSACIFNSNHRSCAYLGIGTVPHEFYSAQEELTNKITEGDLFDMSYNKYNKTNPPEKIDPSWIVNAIDIRAIAQHRYFGDIPTNTLLESLKAYKSRYNPLSLVKPPKRKSHLSIKYKENQINLDRFKDPSFIPYENIKSSTYTQVDNTHPMHSKADILERSKKLSKPYGELFTQWKRDNRDRLSKGYLLTRPPQKDKEAPEEPKTRSDAGRTNSVKQVLKIREKREKYFETRRIKAQNQKRRSREE
ncbi:ATP-dependent RNA helicase DDX54/DBP10 [Nematocida sp. AWRm80]|nr:ATP-dependent RNA helicase DDX54/DBP10 [Nematocida sp. AWRm80]